jgi:hypothetical protein
VQRVRQIKLGVHLAFLGTGLTCGQMALAVLGYELGVRWGHSFLGLTALSFIGALIDFLWPLINPRQSVSNSGLTFNIGHVHLGQRKGEVVAKVEKGIQSTSKRMSHTS